MSYNVLIKAKIESNLIKEELEKKLVVALYDTGTQFSKLDGVDENLEVMDYKETSAKEILLD
jgi:hypothetical protein